MVWSSGTGTVVSIGFSPSATSVTVGLVGWFPFTLTLQMFIYAQNHVACRVSCFMPGPEALCRKHIACSSTQSVCI